MLSHLQRRLGRVLLMLPAVIALLCIFGSLAAAQDQPAPKWELFGGYSFLYTGGVVHGVLPNGIQPVSSQMESNPRGIGFSLTHNFNNWLGLTLDTSTHWGSGETGLFNRIDDAGFSNLSIGPKITFRQHEHFTPFLEILVGDQRLMPDAFHDVDKLGFMVGGGLDLKLTRHIALRLFRADYVVSTYRYGPPTSTPATDVRGLRAQTGLNFMWGAREAPVPPSATCSVEPAEVFAGEAVTAHAAGSSFNPKRTIKYAWNGNGVKVPGTDASAQIDTTGLQPGAYQVSANLADGSKRGVASCSGNFIVKQPRPPVISCAADPTTVRPGGTSAIRSNANSPDNRRLTYAYSASAGNISGTDATATLNTGDAQPGSITVTCTVNDDRNPALTASATTTVAIEAPPPPPPPPAEQKELETKLALHSIYFATARPTERNPEGGLVESQQEILTTLATDFQRYLTFKPDAHLILSGHADPRGTAEYNMGLTQRRVDRTKSFLVEHGVPAADIEVKAFGEEHQLTADEVKQQMQENPDLTPEERQKMLSNLRIIVLANNRRVDVTLSTTGQQSVRRYPFNSKDALTLISPRGGESEKGAKPAPKRPPKKQ